MKYVMSLTELLAAIIIAGLSFYLHNSLQSLYQADDVKQLSQTVDNCSVAVSSLGRNYRQFHEKILPQTISGITAAGYMVKGLAEPTDLMYNVACWSFRIPPFKKQYYPFIKWSGPIIIFKTKVRPETERMLMGTAIMLTDYQNDASKNILRCFPEISTSLATAAKCIGKQEQLNQKIARTVLAIGLTMSILLIVSGIYHWRRR